ncbi:MAG: hypothetical protein ACRDRQ_18060, partial [Pseudonocardiaceae bacterium]
PLLSALPRLRCGSTCHRATGGIRPVGTPLVTSLLSGVDVTVIALWLGHEQVSTTNIYLHADMSQKERAIARTTPPNTPPGRYRAPDTVLAFLEAL